MDIINRTVKLEFDLEDLAKDFGYNLEVDEYEDVFHNGYSTRDIKNQDLRMPEGLEDVPKIFPSVIAIALEGAERSAWAGYIRSERINALKRCLEKIDLSGGGAEYLTVDNEPISTKAGIVSVEIDKGTVFVEVHNPEHLINSVINGVGYIFPDLSPTEPSSEGEIKKRFHNLKDYFEVYGESKPTENTSNQYSPDIDDDYLKEEINFRLAELSLDDVSGDVKSYIDEGGEFDEAINLATKYSEYEAKDIASTILKEIKGEEEKYSKGLKRYLNE